MVGCINTSPGAGRSIPHTHINLFWADEIPLIDASRTETLFHINDGAAAVARFVDCPFVALTVVSESDPFLIPGLMNTIQALDELNAPYNILAVPVHNGGSKDARIVIVPRAECSVDEIKQKVAGFELITGYLVPGEAAWSDMSPDRRDRAIRRATLDETAATELIDMLQEHLAKNRCAGEGLAAVSNRAISQDTASAA